jgi:hypothetical protein
MSTDSREFWIQVRRGLILIIDAIDVRFALPSVRTRVSAPAPPSNGFTPQSERPADGASSITVRKDGG